MLFDDTYKTILKPSEGIFKDKGSKYIAYAFPVRTDEEGKKYLAEIKALHPKARHHCWALRLSPDRSVFRINDDGEPSGTAGRPILNSMLSADVTNLIVIVVRYFGGTLLGVPGLIHAYKTAAQEALNTSEIVLRTVNDVYRFQFNYICMNDVMRIIKEENLTLLKQEYDNESIFEVEIRKANLNRVLDKTEKIEGLTSTYLYTA